MCKAEREWLNCSLRHDKIKLKSIFVRLRKTCDREVQKAKRLYWYTIQNNLLNDCESDLSTFWKSIGKLGVNQYKRKRIPMEIILNSGAISTTIRDVLEKWKK